MDTELQFRKMKKFWSWMVVMVAHNMSVLNTIKRYTLKNGQMLNFVLCILLE